MASLSPLAACVSGDPKTASRPDPSPAESPGASPVPTEPAPTLGWRKIDAVGPGARRDYSFSAAPPGSPALLFGGRAGGEPLADLWRFDDDGWRQISADGPSPRFGHNSALIGEKLLMFGGQGGQGVFFNDLWAFDVATERWRMLADDGPSARYGAGGTALGTTLTISHGFTDAGRFDDTWSFSKKWSDVSPAAGPRPIERCLHRLVSVEAKDRLVLFGGQTNGVPFLGDTWLYDPGAESWTEVKGPAPSPRNLYAAGTASSALFVFGGHGEGGELGDLWSFDGERWSELPKLKPRPGPRGGIDFAVMNGRMLLFGGSDSSGELDDLWELTAP